MAQTEQQTIDGVFGADEQGQYETVNINPVAAHKPLANVSPEKRRMIMGDDGLEEVASSGAYINKRLKDNNADLRTLTYAGRSVPIQLYFRAAYALGMKDPHKELEKIRNGVEEGIAEDKAVLDSIRDKIRTIDNELEGKDEEGEIVNEYAARILLRDAEALVKEYDATIKEEEREKAKEEQEAERQKEIFYDSENGEAEKEQAAQMYKALQENIQQREVKTRGLQDKLATASRSYNTYFDNVEAAESIKARYNSQLDALVLDKQSLEGISHDLRFLASLDTGAMKVTDIIIKHQNRLKHDYNGLVDGLEKIFSRQGDVIRKIPDMIDTYKRKRKKQKEEDVGRMHRSKESQIKLAKQRIAAGIV